MCILILLRNSLFSFGLNNQLIETPEKIIDSDILFEKREKMLKQFQEIMHSILRQNDTNIREKSEYVERIAFVFVIDVNIEPSQFKQVNKLKYMNFS